jgi:hypothetical protein
MIKRLPLLLLLLAGVSVAQAAYLARLQPAGEVSLRLLPGGGVLIRRTATVFLALGDNEITFVLPAEGMDRQQVRLRPLGEGITIRAAESPSDKPAWVRWLVQAAQAGPAQFLLTYPAPRLTWELSYVLRLAPERAAWETWLRLTNKGDQDWQQVQVEGLPFAALTVSLPAGADARFPVATIADLTWTGEYRYDPERYGPAPVALLCLPREPGRQPGNFGETVLPPGRLEIVRAADSVPSTPTRSIDLPYTPRYRLLELNAGPVPTLSVQRRLVSSKQVNLRLDVSGRLALYDLDEIYEIAVTNRDAKDATLTMYERLPGLGEVVESSVEATRYDAQHLIFKVGVPAQAETKVTYRLLRADLEP